jgi:hypothetical protein
VGASVWRHLQSIQEFPQSPKLVSLTRQSQNFFSLYAQCSIVHFTYFPLFIELTLYLFFCRDV